MENRLALSHQTKAQKKRMKRETKTQKIALKRSDEVKIQKSKINISKAKDQKSIRQTKQPRLVNH